MSIADLPTHPTQPFPPWFPYACSVCLCLYFCFANKIIYTIFSRFHIYALIYYVFFFLTYFTLCDSLLRIVPFAETWMDPPSFLTLFLFSPVLSSSTPPCSLLHLFP